MRNPRMRGLGVYAFKNGIFLPRIRLLLTLLPIVKWRLVSKFCLPRLVTVTDLR